MAPPPLSLSVLDDIAISLRPVALCETAGDPERAVVAAKSVYELGADAISKSESPWYEAAEERATRRFAWPGRVVWCGSPASLVVADALLGGTGRGPLYVDELITLSANRSWMEQHNQIHFDTMVTVQMEVERRVHDAWPRRIFHLGHFVEGAVRRAAIQPAVEPALRAMKRAGLEVVQRIPPGVQVIGDLLDFEGRVRNKGSFNIVNFALPIADDALGLVRLTPAYRALAALSSHVGYFILRRDVCLLSSRPIRVRMDAEERPHAVDGPAVAFPDDYAIWAIHGVQVPEPVAVRPESLTVAAVDGEANVEIRRVMIERMGADRFLRESGTEPVHEDETGQLFRREVADDEPLVYVRVVNSTVEPDGSRKVYFLRVPPFVRTAREAVAWTFGLGPSDYGPERET
jgi:hypothetical protein